MSEYADYNSLSKEYDGSRSAVCLDLCLGAFHTKLGIPFGDLHILDAGCGTGNYAQGLLDAGIGNVTLFDANVGMLAKAGEKVKEFVADGRAVVKLHVHKLPVLPYPDEEFDVVMFNHVLHHLDRQDDKFHNYREAVCEARRVLKKDGLLLIQSLLVHQVEKSAWFFCLAPKALESYKAIYLSASETSDVLTEVGFVNVDMITPLCTFLYSEEIYYNGSLDQMVSLDSFWEMVSSEEMTEVKEKFHRMKDEGRLREFITEHDKDRQEVGQTCFIFARKQ
jgi:ubiquinone/menaquinone biosynthesis C-methylase UbiE